MAPISGVVGGMMAEEIVIFVMGDVGADESGNLLLMFSRMVISLLGRSMSLPAICALRTSDKILVFW